MPTVILLDVSLSMFRPVPTADPTESHTRLTIAASAITTLLDYLSLHAKLEYVALVTFSSSYEVTVPFTRDFESIKSKLLNLEEGDKTCIETALHGVNQVILNEWGTQTPVQIILITDGNISVGCIGRSRIMQALPLPPPFPAKINIVPVVSPQDPCLQNAMPLYQKIVDLRSNATNNLSTSTFSRGTIYCPDQLTVAGLATIMTKLCEQQYQEFWCTLKCGQLEARVQLFPVPHPASHENLPTSYSITNQLHVIGFISQQDLGTPIAVSKHLVLPQAQVGNTSGRDNYEPKTPTKDGSSTDGSTTEEDMSDPSKVPNFCVLLHGALKVESMAAVVALGPDWYGTVVAWCEAARARRSCLLLSALAPGVAAAPWLGPLDQLGPPDDSNTAETFPVRSWRSYSGGGSGCAWARPHALLADVQKVLRHARKLPDKTQHLYKELNRLRRSAISLGFSELLTCVSSALERECAALGAGTGAESALQLAHAASALRDPRTALDIKHTLQPLVTPRTC